MADELMLAKLKALSAAELALAWASASQKLAAAKEHHDLVHAALEARYRRKAERALATIGRPDGTVHVIDAGLDVAVTFPGKDEIDQAAMAKALAKVEKLGSNWRDFVKVEYAISRTTLKGLPDKVRRLLEAPISVKLGRIRFAITEAKAAQKKAA